MIDIVVVIEWHVPLSWDLHGVSFVGPSVENRLREVSYALAFSLNKRFFRGRVDAYVVAVAKSTFEKLDSKDAKDEQEQEDNQHDVDQGGDGLEQRVNHSFYT